MGKPRVISQGGWLVVYVLMQGCAQAGSETGPALFEARWTGADSGVMRGPATARWCPDNRFAELLGLQGDTGIAIAIRRLDSLVPGQYPAVLPDSADSMSASATVALRFLARSAVSGYQSDSGSVTLDRDAGGRLSARFQVRARVLGAAGRIWLRGSAVAMNVVRGGEECATPWRPSQ